MTVAIKPDVIISKANHQINGLLSQAELQNCVARSIQVLRDNQATVGFAESCTGGFLSSSFAKVAGVSDVFIGSIVAYANYIKIGVLGVKSLTLEKFGAVSAECSKEMSEKVLMLLKVSYAVSVTGIAGPTGGTKDKSVGTVFISVSGISHAPENKTGVTVPNIISTLTFHHDFSSYNTREDIQLAATMQAHLNLQQFINDFENRNKN